MWARFRAWFSDGHLQFALRREQGSWGAEALLVAHSIKGWGEEGANNRGPDLDILRRGKKLKPWQGGAWCAVACSYEIEEAWAKLQGYSRWDWMPPPRQKRCPVKRSRGAGQLGNRIAKAGTIVPEHLLAPGDFAVYKRTGGGHIAIVSEVTKSGYKTIDGNKGRFNKITGRGSKVREYRHEFGEPNIRFFARLP